MLPKYSNKNFLGIKNPEWWSQETQATFQLCYPWMRGFARIHELYGKGYEVAVIPFENDYGWHFLDKQKSLELAELVIKKHLKNPAYIKQIIKKWQTQRIKLLKVFSTVDKIDLEKLTNKKILAIYNSLMDSYIQEFSLPMVLEAFEPFTADVFLRQFSNFDKQQKQKLAMLSLPKFRSFISFYQVSLLSLVKLVLKDPQLKKLLLAPGVDLAILAKQYKTFFNLLNKHQQEYFWINNTYKNIEYITKEKFLEIIKQEMEGKTIASVDKGIKNFFTDFKKLKLECQVITKELKLNKMNVEIFRLFDIFAPWHDERKRLMMMAGYYINLLLETIVKRQSIPLAELYYYTIEEINKLLASDKRLNSQIAEERRKFSVWVGRGRSEWWLVGEEAKKVREIFFKNNETENSIISGIPASPGLVTGKVRIVLDAINDEFNQDEILVAAMTRPEFVPLMKKAKAVVTNEGGLTCHAAIVCRELGIPCVVGTRVATKVLKDGDEVEIRAHRGEVKKL